MLNIGEKVPDFEMDAFQNNEIKKVKSSDFKGKWLVVIFYPADFTFVCPTELEEAAELHEEFRKTGAEILSVSTDTAYVHNAWHDVSPAIKKINYPMGADPTGKVSRLFGTYMENTGLALRGTFIIDPQGVLRAYEMNELGVGRSSHETLRKLQAAKFITENSGQVCPASWKPGAKTLKPGLDLVGKI